MAVKELVILEEIDKQIFIIRGCRVMLSSHLARLYAVESKALIQAIKRNLKRFPSDFAFQLTWKEWEFLRSQFVTLEDKSRGRGRYSKYPPYAFTQEGIAMLSSVLNSEQAIQVNIGIMRAFVRLRQILSSNKELAHKLKELEQKIERHDEEIQAIFSAIRQLMKSSDLPRRKIGFHQ